MFVQLATRAVIYLRAYPNPYRLMDRFPFPIIRCVRAGHDVWVVVRRSEGRELVVVLEHAGDTLLEAADAVQRFSAIYHDGIFNVD